MSDARELTRWAKRLHEAAGGELRRVLYRELVGVALDAEGRALQWSPALYAGRGGEHGGMRRPAGAASMESPRGFSR